MAQPILQVLVTGVDRVWFSGSATRVICPGEQGTFEVLPLHRPLVSRLGSGVVAIDDRELPIRRGVMRVADDIVTVVIETGGG